MTSTPWLVATIVVLAVGTFGIRLAGPLLRERIEVPPRAEKLLEIAAVVMLTALVATSAVFEKHAGAGLARPLGVLAGGVLAWRRAPFLAVVLTAAATTAGLRLLGVA